MSALLRSLRQLGNMNENPRLVRWRLMILLPVGKFVAKTGLTATFFNFFGLIAGGIAARSLRWATSPPASCS